MSTIMQENAAAGRVMRSARVAAGMTLPTLASRMSYSAGHLASVELGKRPLSRHVGYSWSRAMAGRLAELHAATV